MTTYATPPEATLVATAYGTGSGWYHIERYDNEPPRNRWRLVYPDGTYQRTRTRKDALRLVKLHTYDRAAWTQETQGRA